MLENQQGLENLDDTELIRRYHNGEQEAFQQLAVRYIFVIRNKSSDLYHMGIEKDDLFQEGLLGLHNAVRSFDENGSASFGTYASVCIRNKLVSAVRNANAEKNKINNAASSIDDAAELPFPSEFEPENVVIINEELSSLLDYLRNSLSAKELSVLSCYLDGMTYSQIAEKLNITQKACDNAMQRVRRKLRIKA